MGDKPSLHKTVPCQYEVRDLVTWPGNMQATLVVGLPVELISYTLNVKTNHPILKFVLWDADVQPASGQVFAVTNKHWFQGKKEGEKIELGFQMEFGTGEVPTIESVTLDIL